MTAIVLPDVDFDELRKRIPSLTAIDLPSLQDAGRKADQTIDRVLGRSKNAIWPWVAGFVVIAVIGSIAAMFGWSHRSSTSEDTDEKASGLSAAEASLMSSPTIDV